VIAFSADHEECAGACLPGAPSVGPASRNPSVERLLDPDATAIADGGGLVSAELHPIEGAERIARLLVDLAGRVPDLSLLERSVNGQPGLVAQQDGVTEVVMAFDVAGDRITHMWAVRNPEKLRSWEPG
jgi:RNA polymerase sigma-70 factor (ECF subfamily)